MLARLGYFFGSLAFDRASGNSENRFRIRYRAAQLRCGLILPAPQHELSAVQMYLLLEQGAC